MISNLSEFDFNLVIATARHIVHMFNLMKKKLKIAAATVQVVIEKLVYAHIEQLQYGFWLTNAIAMKLQRSSHPVHT
jgi:hypothetical protein